MMGGTERSVAARAEIADFAALAALIVRDVQHWGGIAFDRDTGRRLWPIALKRSIARDAEYDVDVLGVARTRRVGIAERYGHGGTGRACVGAFQHDQLVERADELAVLAQEYPGLEG
jgi:hypothetical protein